MAAEPSNRDELQRVTLIGCLQRSSPQPSTGKAPESTIRPVGGASGSPDQFTLVGATPAGSASAGVGTQGAGASGGPLVSGRTSYELDALPANVYDAVNKQVEIVGRLDTASAVAASTNPVPTTGNEPVGASGVPRPMPSSGNASTGVSERKSAGPSLRRVAVESVKVVGEVCAAGS